MLDFGGVALLPQQPPEQDGEPAVAPEIVSFPVIAAGPIQNVERYSEHY